MVSGVVMDCFGRIKEIPKDRTLEIRICKIMRNRIGLVRVVYDTLVRACGVNQRELQTDVVQAGIGELYLILFFSSCILTDFLY